MNLLLSHLKTHVIITYLKQSSFFVHRMVSPGLDWEWINREKQRTIRRYETWYCCLFNECTFITRVIQIQARVEEHLIIRSWLVVLLLCDENKSYINLMHAQNMSRLKAKEVVGLNPKRAINSRVFVNPGINSSTVDAFLEVSTHLYSH